MTFESTFDELTPEHVNELAEFINDIDLKYIPMTGSEIKSIFNIDAPAREIKEFEWNIPGAFIAGRIEHNYRIISPAELLKDQEEENTWFDYAATAAVLKYLIEQLGETAVMNKLQNVLDDKFEYLSQGQAKSVIKRYLGLTLSSTERNDIYRLRKKIEGYQQLVNTFSDKLAVNRKRPDRYIDHQPFEKLPTPDEIVDKTIQKLAFMCWECKQYVEFPQGDIIEPPQHHGKPMTLNWNVKDIEHSMQAHQELQDVIANPKDHLQPTGEPARKMKKPPEDFPKLYCKICNTFEPIDEELQKKLDQTDHRISLPKHHGKEMQIVMTPAVIGLTTTDLMEKYNLNDPDRKPGLYFACEECLILIRAEDILPDGRVSSGHVDDIEPPIHHNQKMKPIVIRDYK